MSAALGLGGTLPEPWPDEIQDQEIPDLLPLTFPGHQIRVWHSDVGLFHDLRSDQWEYMGQDWTTTPEVDDWLTGFCYINDQKQGHCVIGVPWLADGHPNISLIFSVRIDK